MYQIVQTLHSYNRWLVMLMILAVLFRSYSGWLGKKPFEKPDNLFSVILLALTHTQLLLGLLLYFFLSPTTQKAFEDFGAAMKDGNLRFYAVEHIFIMLIAVVLIQLGRTFSKKAVADVDKHKKLAIFTTIALVLIIAGIKWA